jgi:hypothetical protein
MRRLKIFLATLTALMLVTGTTAAAASDGGSVRDLLRALVASARFHSLVQAEAAGYGGPLEDLAGIS